MPSKVVDENCEKILALLLTRQKPIRFVELLKDLNGLGAKMSRPTLSQHLHHLQKHKLIVRKRKGKQEVNYAVDWERLKPLEQSINHKKNLLLYIENKERFKSFPIQEQAIYTSNIMTLENVHQLQIFIRNTLDPSKTFYNSLQLLFMHRIYEQYQSWLMESCRESKENAKQALEIVENNIKRVENMLFDKVKQSSVKSTSSAT